MAVSELAQKFNAAIKSDAPALFDALSPLGRAAAFPPDIPFQAQQARGKAFNATIGQITDGKGMGIPLKPIRAALSGLGDEDANRALLYSPIAGIPELRRAWGDWQRRHRPEKPSSLPLVTVGLTHGLSLAADLFAGPDTPVAVATPFWGNYRQTFVLRRGARLLSAPAYCQGRYNTQAISQALEEVPDGQAAAAILNLPSNPGGYSATVQERRQICDSLAEQAARRPLVVICDDAYSGLVYEEGVPRTSIFWDLIGLHDNLIPVKVDGATKEFDLFGGRVGFITFAFDPESQAAAALESKVTCLLRAALGSPVATSQVLLLQALREQTIQDQVEAVRQLLKGRYQVLRQALAEVDRGLLLPMPFNSGCFALIELPQRLGLSAEQVRLHLLDSQDTGLISIQPNFLRVAFCSVTREALPELVRRIEAGVRQLAGS